MYNPSPVGKLSLKAWLRAQSYSAAKLLCRAAKLDSLSLYYDLEGMMAARNMEVSGEAFFIRGPLKMAMPKSRQVVFDVGANRGQYTAEIRRNYSNARVIAFEPNPSSFAELVHMFGSDSNVMCRNIGLGSEAGSLTLYDYAEKSGTGHASLYRDVFSDMHHARRIAAIKVPVERLDNFCGREGIERIDFLKIDTEGHELAVLKGAETLLREERLGVVQFEFNEMNVISRVFLRDFYNMLPGYCFFRLYGNRLIALGAYDSKNEQFKFQNIVAAREPIALVWRKTYC